MTAFQRVIKYLALAFAIFLIVMIVSVLADIFGFFYYFEESDEKIDQSYEKYNSLYTGDFDAIEELEVDLETSSLIIRKGESWNVESDYSRIDVKQVANKLLIEEEGFKIKKNQNKILILTIPSNFQFSKISLDAGYGNVEIGTLVADNMSLDIGAGKLVIDNLVVNDKLELSGGAGSIEILRGQIHNFDMEMGVGSVQINASLLGSSKIEAGVGEISLNLQDSINNYKFKIEKGLGDIKINEVEMKNETIYGNGSNFVEIEGGVGSIKIITNN